MPSRKVPSDDILRGMYESGLSGREIALQLGLNANTVMSYLSRKGIVTRGSGDTAHIQFQTGRREPLRYWLGKKQPADMVEHRADSVRGDKHPQWKGGKYVRRYRKIKEKTFCALCGSKRNLCIHHVDLNHFNDNPDNLQILCVSCHASVHVKAYWAAVHLGVVRPKYTGKVGWIESRKKSSKKNFSQSP